MEENDLLNIVSSNDSQFCQFKWQLIWQTFSKYQVGMLPETY